LAELAPGDLNHVFFTLGGSDAIDSAIRWRATEFAAAESHFARLREGRAESIESSSLHLDILRDLKRIHSNVCSVAYPVLERTAELQPS
jgi:phosphate:Na+ symporter